MFTEAERPFVNKLAAAWVQLRNDLLTTDSAFKIGRTQSTLASPEQLTARYQTEYPMERVRSARAILADSPANIANAEKALIAAAWEDFPIRCINEQLGGGGQGEDDQHAVYVVLFDKSATLTDLAWQSRFLRFLRHSS